MLMLLLFLIGLLPFGSPSDPYLSSCFYQRCLGCRAEETMYYAGVPRDCSPKNWVTPQWVHNYGHPPPSTDSKVQIQMGCLKMVATPDDKQYGNTVDVIKGCIPMSQADSVCLGLEAIQRARGHSDAKCFVCTRMDCNASSKNTIQIPLLLTTILYFVLR